MAREKYLNWPVEEPESLLIKTLDVPKLEQEIAREDRTETTSIEHKMDAREA